MIRLVVARGSRPTGDILAQLLRERGLELANGAGGACNGYVSYGVRLAGNAPSLNANAGGGDKLAELQALAGAGISVPQLWTSNQWRDAGQHLPVVARNRQHTRGTDIRVIRRMDKAREWSTRRDFFTKLIDVQREFRTQIFRSAHLGTYEKVLEHPEMRKSVIARNLRNGYVFRLCTGDNIPRQGVDLSRNAIAALNLDFGAVDWVMDRRGTCYVLEANTAPGGEDSRQWLQSLADKIVNWTKKGYPGRKQDKNAQ